MRNPWGNGVEWVEQESAEDGEFLMPWPAFLSTFHQAGLRSRTSGDAEYHSIKGAYGSCFFWRLEDGSGLTLGSGSFASEKFI